MLPHSAETTEERVLIFAPTGRDADLTRTVLADAGFVTLACPTLDSLCQEMEAGAGAVLLTAEEAFSRSSLDALQAVLERQEPWSDLPLIMLTLSGLTTHTVLETLRSSGILVLLERSVPVNILVSAVRTALQARRRQYHLRDLLQRLETANHQKDQFLAMLAHELRNPLAPMSNAAQLLRMRGPLDPATERFRDVVERQVQHMSRLVDDLLDVSRLTRGKIELHRAPVDLTYLLQQIAEDHRNELTAVGLTLNLELPDEPVWVDGDATRLVQVLANLLHNATKFTPAGGQVTVASRIADCGSRLGDGGAPGAGSIQNPKSKIQNECAVVSVRDTGAGIEPEMLPHVFDSFAQADPGMDRSGGGLGLGLTLVKQLVELHGGQVSAASEGPGCGAEFTLRLPLMAPPAASPDKQSRSDGQQSNLRVLLVEAHRDSADTLRELLQLAGHQVAVARSGALAIELAQQFRPNVVLCDLELPEMEGDQVAAALRRDPTTASARLIALSGDSQEEARRHSQEAGFDLHLTKPVDPAELERLLATVPLSS
jgi:signal transduction histidine kinase